MSDITTDAAPAPVTAPPPEPLLSRREAARALGVSVSTLDSLRARRAIEHVRIGGSIRFTPSGLAKYRESCTVPALA